MKRKVNTAHLRIFVPIGTKRLRYGTQTRNGGHTKNRNVAFALTLDKKNLTGRIILERVGEARLLKSENG